eukprot:1148956-Pelagomonas_calceolata.AAC.3
MPEVGACCLGSGVAYLRQPEGRGEASELSCMFKKAVKGTRSFALHGQQYHEHDQTKGSAQANEQARNSHDEGLQQTWQSSAQKHCSWQMPKLLQSLLHATGNHHMCCILVQHNNILVQQNKVRQALCTCADIPWPVRLSMSPQKKHLPACADMPISASAIWACLDAPALTTAARKKAPACACKMGKRFYPSAPQLSRAGPHF